MEQSLQAYIDTLLKSKEYQKYAEQNERVKEYPDLKKQIDEFRKRNFEMQNSGDLVFEKIEAFEREYSDFRDNPLVADFLEAELAFCRMMQAHYGEVMKAIDFE
jgi:cell fate (sporulation/competence/biofilm development) regulator YlbF (YheA/YmcA/DUF963 family)